MNDNYESNKEKEIDFMGNLALKKVIKKSKMKQTIKYIIITILTTSILLAVLFMGSQYILNKRINNQDFLYYTIHGANISFVGTTYTHNLFSVFAETTY